MKNLILGILFLILALISLVVNPSGATVFAFIIAGALFFNVLRTKPSLILGGLAFWSVNRKFDRMQKQPSRGEVQRPEDV